MCGIWTLISKNNIIDKNFSKFFESFLKIRHRGPDYISFNIITPKIILGFARLAIMDLTTNGQQPFQYTRDDGSRVYCICNGEIYDYENIKKAHNITTQSSSDCEIIIPLYETYGVDMFSKLGSEFALIIIDIKTDGSFTMLIGRDPIGVRPLFYGISEESICLASEMKGISDLHDNIKVFPPGHYMTYDGHNLNTVPYYNYNYKIKTICDNEIIYENIRKKMISCVEKRLMSDREYGSLLSGGLDSSLVCGIIKYLRPKINFPVFTITFKSGGTDLPFARKTAEFLNLTHHHIIEITDQEALDMLDETIYTVESYDITTIRASCMQMLIAKYINKNTKVKVLFCGENSDELFAGYKYSHYAPDSKTLREDNINLVENVHRYDGLRTDRTMARYGLEVRPPFSDTEIIDYVFSLPEDMTCPKNGIEKYLLRRSFADMKILPDEVLWRHKEALSDGCSSEHKSWFHIIQDKINTIVSDEEYETHKNKYIHNTPFTKESYYYRKKFVEYYGDSEYKAKLIPYFWMPKWTDTNDPSARVLSVYKR